MVEALRQTQVAGVTTNIDYLVSVISHQAFQEAEFDTGFIEYHQADLSPGNEPAPPEILSLAALYQVLRRACLAGENAAISADPTSPWWATDSWRLNLLDEEHFRFHDGVREHEVGVTVAGKRHNTDPYPSAENNIPGQSGNDYVVRTGGKVIRSSGRLEPDSRLVAMLDNTQWRTAVVEDHEHLIIFGPDHTYRLKRVTDTGYSSEEEASGTLISPMPGRVMEVMAAEGQQVKKGDALLVLEAMKIEHIIAAPHDGTVHSLHYRTGDMVEEGVELLLLTD